jgi:polyphosphate kinase
MTSGKKNSKAKAGKTEKSSRAPVAEDRFLDRDESWMKFNERVLEEAEDPENPLLERVKFLAITASNLDEFFEIRVAGTLQRIEDGFSQTWRMKADEPLRRGWTG